MPDRRRHRGPHPGDRERFAADVVPALRAACADFAFLLERGYADASALKLVGDRHRLDQRQRLCVQRCTCTAAAAAQRRSRELPEHARAGSHLLVDGFNVLITVEAALAGGVLLLGRDGCLRDLASMHGTWRTVAETASAAALAFAWLERHRVAAAEWLLDRPVANSGRLAALLRSTAAARGHPWQVRVSDSPDRELRAAAGPVATADSAVLDRCGPWLNLARHVVEEAVVPAWILDLSQSSAGGPDDGAPQRLGPYAP